MSLFCFSNRLAVFGKRESLIDFFEKNKNAERGLYIDFSKSVPEPEGQLEDLIENKIKYESIDARFSRSQKWRKQNWGSRFQPAVISPPVIFERKIEYLFETSGLPPIFWLENAVPSFLDLSFCLSYFKKDLSWGGATIFKNGQIYDRSTGEGKDYRFEYGL